MNLNNSISLKYVLAILAALAYITICFVIDVEKGVSFYQSTVKNYSHSNKGSELIVPNKQSEDFCTLKNQIVELDTLVYRIDRYENISYLIARVICDNENKIMVKLAIDPKNTENYESLIFKKVRLIAVINQINSFPYEKEIYDLENTLVWHHSNSDYILEGNLEEIVSSEPVTG